MKIIFFSLFFLTFADQLEAKVINLPLGGKINISDEKWIVSPNPLMEGKSLILLHKEEKALRGYVLNGSIQTSVHCQGQNDQPTKWTICSELISKDKNDYHQITLERKLSTNTFQRYLVSFTFPKEKRSRFRKLIEALAVDLEK